MCIGYGGLLWAACGRCAEGGRGLWPHAGRGSRKHAQRKRAHAQETRLAEGARRAHGRGAPEGCSRGAGPGAAITSTAATFPPPPLSHDMTSQCRAAGQHAGRRSGAQGPSPGTPPCTRPRGQLPRVRGPCAEGRHPHACALHGGVGFWISGQQRVRRTTGATHRDTRSCR